jgi:hypothetical protein
VIRDAASRRFISTWFSMLFLNQIELPGETYLILSKSLWENTVRA